MGGACESRNLSVNLVADIGQYTANIDLACKQTQQSMTDIQRAARFFYLQQYAFDGKVDGQSSGTATTAPAVNAAHLRLKPIEFCVIHGTRLESTCSECGKHQPFFPKHHYLDYCSHCSKSLSTSSSKREVKLKNNETDDFVRFCHESIAQMIEFQYDKSALTFKGFQRRLREVIDSNFDGMPTRFEKAIGFRRKLIDSWLRSTRPSFILFLTLMFRLKTSPVHFMVSGVSSSYDSAITGFAVPEIKTRLKLTSRAKGKIGERLNELISSGNVDRPMVKIADELGYSYGFLNYWFPDECRQISNLFRIYRNKQSVAKKKSATDIAKMVVTQMFEAGEKITRRSVQKRLYPHRIFLSHPGIRAAIREQKLAHFLPIVETNRKRK